MSKVVLITGASSGIGLAIAAYLTERGYTVFGTSRRPGAERLHSFTLLPLDVTDDESVAACVQTVMQRAGRIDVLINNAAYSITGGVEDVSSDEAKAIFEVNFFGAARMTRAVLPHMRAQGSGQIISISSAMAFMPLPFEAYYSASKTALDGWSEALYQEVAPFNVHVAVIHPGFYRSEIRQRKQFAAALVPAYDAERARRDAFMDRSVEHGRNPREIAQLVHWLIRQRPPFVHYPISPLAVQLMLGKRLLPFPLLRLFTDGGTYGRDGERNGLITLGIQAALVAGVLWLLVRPFRRRA